MKRLTILLATLAYCMSATAQEDSTTKTKPDTMRIGNILIIKKAGQKDKDYFDSSAATIDVVRDRSRRKSRITTNWGIVDLGFTNYSDHTNYANPGSYLVSNPATGVPAISSSDFKLRTGKSVNVNIWFFMQTLNLVKRNVNLKYGLGLELNNYRYKSGITYKENGKPYASGQSTNAPFIYREDSIGFSKNKLAADYLTVPLMVNFASNQTNEKKRFILSAGVSAGYLYSQRNKQKSDANGKQKNKGEYDLEKFKISYIAEIGYGSVRFYGSYSPQSIYERSLDIRPYTFGIRFSDL